MDGEEQDVTEDDVLQDLSGVIGVPVKFLKPLSPEEMADLPDKMRELMEAQAPVYQAIINTMRAKKAARMARAKKKALRETQDP